MTAQFKILTKHGYYYTDGTKNRRFGRVSGSSERADVLSQNKLVEVVNLLKDLEVEIVGVEKIEVQS